MLYMASQRRRRLIIAIPMAGTLLLALAGFFIRQDDTLETQGDWNIIFWVMAALSLVLLALIIRTPERTKKRLRLDALPPVASTLNSWYIEHRKNGKVSIPYYFVMVGSAEALYLSANIQGALLKTIQPAHVEQKLVVMMEEGFAKGLAKTLKKYPLADITGIESTQGKFTLTLASGEEQPFLLSNEVDYFEVGTVAANLVMPGIAGHRHVEEVEVGRVRKKMVRQETLIFNRAPVSS